MSRFSIRELLLLTVIAALAIGWYVQSRRLAREIAAIRQKLEVQTALAELNDLIATIKPNAFGSQESSVINESVLEPSTITKGATHDEIQHP